LNKENSVLLDNTTILMTAHQFFLRYNYCSFQIGIFLIFFQVNDVDHREIIADIGGLEQAFMVITFDATVIR